MRWNDVTKKMEQLDTPCWAMQVMLQEFDTAFNVVVDTTGGLVTTNMTPRDNRLRYAFEKRAVIRTPIEVAAES
jgi:hypothetical protein